MTIQIPLQRSADNSPPHGRSAALASSLVVEFWCASADQHADALSLASSIRLSPNRDCSVASIPRFGSKPPAFLKVFDQPRLFRNELQGLKTAGSFVAESAVIGAPRILHIIESANAIVMEHVAGVRFDRQLRRSYLTPADWYLAAFENLGRWLADFHRPVERDGIQAEIVERYVNASRAALARATKLVGSGRTRQAARLLDRIQLELESRELEPVQCHGDFSLGNVMARQRELKIVDFAYSGPGFREMDLIPLRVSLQRSIGYLPFSGGLRTRLWSAFSRGYGEVSPNRLDPPMADLVELHLLAFSVGSPFERLWRSPRAAVIQLHQFMGNLLALRTWIDTRVREYGL